MEYTPKPVSTDHIVLEESLLNLAERLAENVHEIWAQGRVAEGWTYGPVRSDDKKQTPCLVPYDQLPEEEKAYDRNTALETVKLILSMGYEIRKK